jgi:hypothetical protein
MATQVQNTRSSIPDPSRRAGSSQPPMHRASSHSHHGSIYEVRKRFQPFGISDVEMVAQMFISSNPLTSWLRAEDNLRSAKAARDSQGGVALLALGLGSV